MIMVTRSNGSRFAVNPDLIERIEETPDTVISLAGGTKYVVAESIAELVDEIRTYRATVIAYAEILASTPSAAPNLRLVPGTES